MHTVFETEKLNPFLDTQLRSPFHSVERLKLSRPQGKIVSKPGSNPSLALLSIKTNDIVNVVLKGMDYSVVR